MLQDKHGMAYATAIKLRSKLSADLAKFHGGLLGRCICVNFPRLPQDMVFGLILTCYFWNARCSGAAGESLELSKVDTPSTA